jgi:hypothetical protein
MMRYTVEITQHTTLDAMKEHDVYGKDAAQIAEVFGVEMREDWQNKKYMRMMVPSKKVEDTTIFKQSFEDLDLGAVVVLLNSKTIEEKKGGDSK